MINIQAVKRVAILCAYRFPEGMAPTTRIIAYSKGLVNAGVNVEVIIFRPTEKGIALGPLSGEIDGIKYFYTYKRVWSKSSLGRWLWDRPVLYFKLFSTLFRKNSRGKYDFIFLSFDLLRFLYVVIPYIKLLGIRLIFIADEFPIPIRHKLKEKIPLYKTFLYRLVFTYLDGMVLMTNKLKVYFTSIKNRPAYILPSITDLTRFASESNTSVTSPSIKYICYMGNMELAKDNVDNIIKAFHLIHEKHGDIELRLYGTPNIKDRTIIETSISNLDLTNKVYLKGKVNYYDVPQVLKNSFILVSSQPVTLRAAGGFPTKLGEYLASGVPVVVTDVGEISTYVTHGKHLWLAKPDNPEDFAKNLDFVIENYPEAKKIALDSMQFAYDNFDANKVATGLKVFLTGLNKA